MGHASTLVASQTPRNRSGHGQRAVRIGVRIGSCADSGRSGCQHSATQKLPEFFGFLRDLFALASL